MAISKPPRLTEKAIEALIDQAPAVHASPATSSHPTREYPLTVRVPPETLQRIDKLVRGRRARVPRHSWLLEAIYEKLDREDPTENV